MSLPRSHPPLKWMGNFKAVAIDYEFYLTLSDKPQSICLTERQMYVLSVQNTYTAWLTRWYNTDDITQKTVQFIAAEIEGLLMCGCGIPVPSVTDRINTQIYNNDVSNTYITNQTTYHTDGDTLNTLAPNMTYATGDPADINRMLCLGLEMLLKTIISQAQGTQEMDENQQQDLVQQLGIAMGGLAGAGSLAIAAGGSAATVVAVIGGPWTLLGLAIGGIAVGIASLFVSTDIAALTDTDAYDQVLCTLRENAMDNEPSFTLFNGLLEPNEFEPGSHAEELAAIVQPFLDNLTVYLQFMMVMSDLYGTSLLAALPECEVCPEPPPDPECDDLTAGPFGWADSAQTKWWAGSGLGPTGAGGVQQFIIDHSQEATNRVVVEVKFHFNMSFPNVLVTMGILGSAVVSSVGNVITLNEASHPSLFPFNTASAGAIQVRSNAASFIAPTGIRMEMACFYVTP